ncbi:MAG: GAF domain-containing protein, partial [Acidobacteria bacterium]|nr:GAF domain-containing protein [Acidobacteriota bacterium]
MDSLDTILEHLKQTQDRGRNAIEGRVETIADRLSQLVDEATASVRETMAHEVEELFPAADLKQALEELNGRVTALEQEKADVAQELDWAQRRLTDFQAEGVAEAPSGGPSLELLRNLDRARSQSELLKELLPALCDVAARAVVLVIRGGDVSAWSGIGFADGESLRQWQTTVPASPALHALVSESRPVRFQPEDDEVFRGWLDAEGLPGNALLVPVCLRGQLMGCLYLDDGEGDPWDPDSAQGLVAVACWMIDTLHARQEVPSSMVAEPLTLESEPEGVPEPEDAEPAFEEPEAVTADDTPAEVEDLPEGTVEEAPAAVEPEYQSASEPEESVEVEEVEPAVQDFDPSATMRVEVAPELVEMPPEPVDEVVVEETEPEPEPEPATESAEVAPAPSPAVVPPPPLESAVEEEPTEAVRTDEAQAQHEEARRFARLLISEIKLYNE